MFSFPIARNAPAGRDIDMRETVLSLGMTEVSHSRSRRSHSAGAHLQWYARGIDPRERSPEQRAPAPIALAAVPRALLGRQLGRGDRGERADLPRAATLRPRSLPAGSGNAGSWSRLRGWLAGGR